MEYDPARENIRSPLPKKENLSQRETNMNP
jgi:hypothetical protein